MIHSEHLIYMLNRFGILDEFRGVEVGVRHGDNAQYMLDHLPVELTLIDPFAPYQDVEHNYTQEEQMSLIGLKFSSTAVCGACVNL